ncbi:hypothetical protein CGRA01v4_07477 [Colletotrichum graminicola]|nr:hypothetical protein CGRA01v4_07477 [Colletotrichum graminicola]
MGAGQADASMVDGSSVACLASVFPRPRMWEFVRHIAVSFASSSRKARSSFHHELGRQATNNSARSGGMSSVARESVCMGGRVVGFRILAHLRNPHSSIPHRPTPRDQRDLLLSTYRLDSLAAR